MFPLPSRVTVVGMVMMAEEGIHQRSVRDHLGELGSREGETTIVPKLPPAK